MKSLAFVTENVLNENEWDSCDITCEMYSEDDCLACEGTFPSEVC